MSVGEVGEALRDLRYRRGAYADERTRMRFTAQVHSVLKPGTVSRLIFTATVVERLPYKMVARELSISLRQFFRLRNQMIDEIRAGLEVDRVDVAATVNDDRVQLEIVRRLLDHGHTKSAAEALNVLVKRPLDSADYLDWLLLQARAECDLGSYTRARERLDEASFVAARIGGEERRESECDIALARSYALYRDGQHEAALEASQTALPAHAVVPCTDPYKARKLARHGILLAIQHEEGGSLEFALDYLRASLLVLSSLEHPPAAELAQIYLHRAFARAGMPAEVAAAPRDAIEAIRLAEWHSLPAELVWANLAFAMATYSSNPLDLACPAANRAMQLAREHLSGDPLARTLFLASRFECAAGRPGEAVRLVLEAKPHIENNNLLLAIYPLAEARARHANGEQQRTIEADTVVIAAGQERNDALLPSIRALGVPYRVVGGAKDSDELNAVRAFDDGLRAAHELAGQFGQA